jgi:uncharacterized protein (DUF305 family)
MGTRAPCCAVPLLFPFRSDPKGTSAMKRILVLSAAAAIALTGCSSSGSTNSTSPTSTGSSIGAGSSAVHNNADVAFATEMIPHHAQAIQMADMAPIQAVNSTVKSLSAAIEKAQDPEIVEMSAWLKTWGQPVPSASSGGGMGGMNTGGGTGTGAGMMSASEMANLGKARGATFDRMWVTMMITHHQGAVSMATTELGAGSNPDAKSLARSIISSQNAQIQQMQTLLKQLPAE